MDVLKFECTDYQITVSTASVNYAWDRFVRRVKNAATTYCAYSSSHNGTLLLSELATENKILLRKTMKLFHVMNGLNYGPFCLKLANISLLLSSSKGWIYP